MHLKKLKMQFLYEVILKKKLLGILVLGLSLMSCSTPTDTVLESYKIKPKILGSTHYWTDFHSIIKDVKVNNLHVRKVKIYDEKCVGGFSHVLEINGIINEDTTFIIKKLLDNIKRCVDSKGTTYAGRVYINSGGGLLNEGYKLGKIFKKHSVQATITNGQVCMSSCVTAFLGAKFRKMNGDATLLVHSPYRYKRYYNIECKTKAAAKDLKNYYVTMLGYKSGELLFDRTMRYCGESNGWVLNKDAAEIFGLLN